MSGRESLAQTFTLLSFGSAGLIGLVHIFDGVSPLGTGDSVRRLMPMQDTNAARVISVAEHQDTVIQREDSTEDIGNDRLSDSSNVGPNQAHADVTTEFVGLFSRATPNSNTNVPQTTDNQSLNRRENSQPPIFVSSVAQSSSVHTSEPFLGTESNTSAPRQSRESPNSETLEQPFLRHESMMVHSGFSTVQLFLRQLSTQMLDSQPSSRLVVDLSDRQVVVFQDGKLAAVFPIAVGRAGWETPAGEFEVINKQEDPVWQNPMTNQVVQPGEDNPLGTHWIGFWSDGLNQIGFHGTNQNHLIGQAVSHGCIRMENEHIQQLYEHVSIGTSVSIQL